MDNLTHNSGSGYKRKDMAKPRFGKSITYKFKFPKSYNINNSNIHNNFFYHEHSPQFPNNLSKT